VTGVTGQWAPSAIDSPPADSYTLNQLGG